MLINIDEARRELESYRFTECTIRNGEQPIREYREQANKLVATYELIEGSSGGGKNDRLANYAIKAAEEEMRKIDELNALRKQNSMIRRIVMTRMFGKYQMLLAETYFYGMTMEDVQQEVGGDIKHLYYERTKAVKLYARLRENEKTS